MPLCTTANFPLALRCGWGIFHRWGFPCVAQRVWPIPAVSVIFFPLVNLRGQHRKPSLGFMNFHSGRRHQCDACRVIAPVFQLGRSLPAAAARPAQPINPTIPHMVGSLLSLGRTSGRKPDRFVPVIPDHSSLPVFGILHRCLPEKISLSLFPRKRVSYFFDKQRFFSMFFVFRLLFSNRRCIIKDTHMQS